MDGNRRWARAHGLTVREGHAAGKRIFMRVFDYYDKLYETWGTKNYIFYAFSTENWRRDPTEVAAIFTLIEEACEEFASLLPRLQEAGIRIRFIGQCERLPQRLAARMREIEQATAGGNGGTVALAVSYGGRADILQAINSLLAHGAREISGEMLSEALWTADIPVPDLIIRPGGERRLSNFLLWESAYSELVFSPTLWPDFSEEELVQCFADYACRERREGH